MGSRGRAGAAAVHKQTAALCCPCRLSVLPAAPSLLVPTCLPPLPPVAYVPPLLPLLQACPRQMWT